MNIERFERILRRLTKFSDHHQHKMACLIIDKNRVVSFGWNQDKTHPKSTHPWRHIHAEVHAIIGNTFEDLKGCTAIIYRENKMGEKSMARPCPTCLESLKMVGIKRIIYTAENRYIEEDII